MELWIRSQDKTKLIKVDEIEFREDDYGFYIFAWKDKFEGSRTGTYATKERALEVLDEIQNIIKQQLMFHIDKSQCNTIEDIDNPKFIIRDVGIPRVYQMPEE